MHYKTCEICGIRSGRVIDQKRTFMAKFPLDEDRCKKWVKVTGKEDLAYIPIEKLHELKYICGKHFKATDFKKKKTQLRKKAVPSLLLTSEPLQDEILVEFPLHIFADNKPISTSNKLSNSHYLYNTASATTSEIKNCILDKLQTEIPSSTSIQLAIPEYDIIMEHNYCQFYIKSQKLSVSNKINSSRKRSVSPNQSTPTAEITKKNREYSLSRKKKRKEESDILGTQTLSEIVIAI